MKDVFIAFAFFGVIPLIVFTITRYRHKTHKSALALMGAVVEKGDTLTPDVIQALGIRPSKPHGDLRLGVILVAIGIAMTVLGQVIPEDEADVILAGLAMFPLLVGAAYIGLWVFISRKPSA